MRFNPVHPYFLKIALFSENFWLGKEKNYKNFKSIIEEQGWTQKFHGLDVISQGEITSLTLLLNKLGFSWIMNCHEISVNPEDITVIKQPSVVSLKKAMAGLITFDDFKSFLIQRYIETHNWNPVGHFSAKQWDNFFANKVSLDFSMLIIREGEIIAASWASVEDSILDVIWTFLINQVIHINRQELVQQLILEQIRLAIVRNLERVTFEIDSTDKDLFPILSLLTPREETIFKRYRYNFK